MITTAPMTCRGSFLSKWEKVHKLIEAKLYEINLDYLTRI